MVGIDGTDQGRGLCQPLLEIGQQFLGKGTGLIAYLPRHDGRVVHILQPRITVGTVEDKAHIVVEQLLRLGTLGEPPHEIHIGRIAILIGAWCFSLTCMLQIEAIAPTPLPGVVQVEHSHHLPFPHLHQQEVESGQDGIVIHARLYLQRWLHLGGHAPFAITPHEDSQVVDAHLFHQVQFLYQTLAIAPLPFRAEDSPIPEVRAYEIIGLTVFHEMTVLHSHKFRLSHHWQSHSHQ